jgi:hypothetical protein
MVKSKFPCPKMQRPVVAIDICNTFLIQHHNLLLSSHMIIIGILSFSNKKWSIRQCNKDEVYNYWSWMFFGWLICWHAPLDMWLVDSENNSKTDRIPCLSQLPATQALCLIFFPSLLPRGQRGTRYGNEGVREREGRERERETEIVVGERESERQTHRGPWQLPITLPRAAERERRRDSALRRPRYTMWLPRHFYIMCSVQCTGLVYVTFMRV